MKFSILVPVYNVASYLEECVKSVLDQDCRDYELILVDDGSTDGSGQICDRYASEYPDKVKVIHKKNEGVLLARIHAVKEAGGEIVVFLDADDCLRRDALMRILDTFSAYRCDMVMYNFSTVPDYSVPGAVLPFGNRMCFDGENKKIVYETICSSSLLNVLWMRAVKRELAQTMLEYEKYSFVKNGEDLLCSLPMITRAESIVYIDQNLYYYRQRPGSAIHSVNPQRYIGIQAVHQEMERYIDLWGMPELHPIHHAREVRGWIETLKISSRMEYDSDFFASMAQDSYFRNAYEKMDKSCLKKRDLFLAGLLYNRRFRLLREIWTLHRWVRSIKGLFHTF